MPAKVIRSLHLCTNYELLITSGSIGTIAISGDGALLASKTNTDTRNQAAVINIMINEVIDQVGIALADLSTVVVCAGPGSYTGLRIGMATAKALCYVLDKPLVLHNKLTLLAKQQLDKAPGYDLYMPLLKAREREYFIAVYDNAFNCIVAPQHIMESRMADLVDKNKTILIAGDADENAIKNLIINNIHIITAAEIDINAWAVFSHTVSKCNENVNLSTAEPFYLKPAYTTK
jgi:tRNA threonylcarbamoyladenosine biosynthesis protein TsaB